MQRRRFLRRGVVVALVGFAGCGGDGGTTATPTETDSTPTTEETPSPTRTPSPTESASPTEQSMATGTPTATAPPETATNAPTPTDTPSPTPTDAPTSTPSPTETGQADQVVEVGPDGSFRFSPETFTIGVGDTVLWTWKSGGHNVRPDSTPSGSSWSGTPGGDGTTYDSGYTHSHEFTVAGDYEYYCAPHRSFGMTGSFTVE